MSKLWIRLSLILTAAALLAVGCSSTQGAPPAAATIAPPIAATTAPATTTSAPSPTQAPAASTGSGSNTIRFVLRPEKSEARYRVREQLANVSLPSDAIGRTNAFTGTIVVNPDGSIAPAESKFVVDVSTLKSDRSQRDNYLRGNVLQTNQYPTAVFAPTQITGLATLPQSGPVSFKLMGDLTIRNVTKPVTWDFSGQVQGGELTGQATTTFKFEDFSLTQPRVPVVLSVEDNIRLELDLNLQMSS